MSEVTVNVEARYRESNAVTFSSLKQQALPFGEVNCVSHRKRKADLEHSERVETVGSGIDSETREATFLKDVLPKVKADGESESPQGYPLPPVTVVKDMTATSSSIGSGHDSQTPKISYDAELAAEYIRQVSTGYIVLDDVNASIITSIVQSENPRAKIDQKLLDRLKEMSKPNGYGPYGKFWCPNGHPLGMMALRASDFPFNDAMCRIPKGESAEKKQEHSIFNDSSPVESASYDATMTAAANAKY